MDRKLYLLRDILYQQRISRMSSETSFPLPGEIRFTLRRSRSLFVFPALGQSSPSILHSSSETFVVGFFIFTKYLLLNYFITFGSDYLLI